VPSKGDFVRVPGGRRTAEFEPRARADGGGVGVASVRGSRGLGEPLSVSLVARDGWGGALGVPVDNPRLAGRLVPVGVQEPRLPGRQVPCPPEYLRVTVQAVEADLVGERIASATAMYPTPTRLY